MDRTATPTRISRVDSRYRHRAQDVAIPRRSAPTLNEEEGGLSGRDSDGDLRSMSRHHRFFHRRAGQNTRVVTVAVEVVATVDTNGVLVAKETMAPVTPQASSAPTGAAVAVAVSVGLPQQILPSALLPAASLPAVPSVPPMPTAVFPSMPSVPSVPHFPSDLTVPAYPFASGASVIQVVASSDSISASPIPTSAPGSTAASSASPAPVLVSPISSLANSTVSSTYSQS
jgi:hypothetical protein